MRRDGGWDAFANVKGRREAYWGEVSLEIGFQIYNKVGGAFYGGVGGAAGIGGFAVAREGEH